MIPVSTIAVCNWFERLGYLVRRGHVGLEQVRALFGDDAIFWWTVCDPFVRRTRARTGQSGILEEFEFLAEVLRREHKRETDKDWVMWDTVGDQIDGYTRLIQVSLDAERGAIPQRRVVGPAPAAQAATAEPRLDGFEPNRSSPGGRPKFTGRARLVVERPLMTVVAHQPDPAASHDREGLGPFRQAPATYMAQTAE